MMKNSTASVSGLSLPNPENIVRQTLPNGITVLVYENFTAQSVVLTGSLHAGSIYEDFARNGLASMTASALLLGTQARDFDTINSSLEDIGADLDISSGNHRVGFSGKSLAEDLPTLLGLLAEALRLPVFPQEHIERMRGETLTWLQYRLQDTRWQSGRVFRENLYPVNHSYHYSTRGTVETLPTLTIDEMRAFHAQHYGPRDMIVVIVGAVRAQEAIALVEQLFGDWQNPNQPEQAALPTINPPNETQRIGVNIPGKTQADLVLGTLGPSRFAPDYQAANMANSILGQFGMMGRIGDVVREQGGMAYYAYSRLDGGLGPGAWSISAGVNPANIDRALELSINELRRLTTELVSDEDIEDNKSYFTGRLPLQLESNEGIASTLLSMETYQLGLDYLIRYPGLINSLTKEDLLAAAQRYLNPDALVVAIAGPDVE
ncbi:MAG: pitrilysin family protein [bacterium]|nr:pitrilysin family protein [bacterium]